MTEIDRILTLWLKEIGPSGWYKSNAEIDARLRRDFEGRWRQAAADGLTRWLATPRGSLAFLLLTDQFSRNMFRGGGQAFATDRCARKAAKIAIARGHDLKIEEPARQFFLMPLMHSESLSDQELCICRILTSMPLTGRKNNLPHAIKHREIIRRFGRFPSRNAALGRKDTDAELAYRAEGGYMG